MAEKKAVETKKEELPKTIVRRLVKDTVSKCSKDGDFLLLKDSLLAFSASSRLFIQYLSATAHDLCKESNREVMNADDVLKALEVLEFPEFVEPLKASLEGGHTVGVAHCSLFQDRLYNFNQTGGPDPTMDLVLLVTLRLRCPQNPSVDNTASLDQGLLGSTVVDNSYHQQILLNRGILQIDQQLALDPSTKPKVAAVASSLDFKTKFGQAMVKMGAVQVLTGIDGEVRSSCRVKNSS